MARAAHTGHHGTFQGTGPGPKPGKLGKMGKGPHGPPGGPRGAHRGQYGSVLKIRVLPQSSIQSPQNSTPIRTRELFRKTQNRFPTESVNFHRKVDISETLPRVVDLSGGCPQVHTDRSGWVRTHTGTRNCLSGQYYFFRFQSVSM